MKKLLLTITGIILTVAFANATEPYKPKREISIQFGDWFDKEDVLNEYYDYWSQYTYWGTPLEHYNTGNIYYGNKTYLYPVIVSYTQELKRWLALNFTISYYNAHQKIFDSRTDKVSNKYSQHNFAFIPMVRFTYLNHPIVRVYSAIGIGITCKRAGWTNDRTTENYISGHLTGLGVSVGKNIFGMFEFGVGEKGFINIGTGYRF